MTAKQDYEERYKKFFTQATGIEKGPYPYQTRLATDETFPELLGVKPDDDVQVFITVERQGSEIEKWPYRGFIQFKVPTDEFEAMMWQV